MDLQTFIISILSSGAIAAIITGLINHRTQIQAIKESGLYAKRAEVLDELMRSIEKLDRIMGELISFFQNDGTWDAEKARREKSRKSLNYFIVCHRRSRHYLPKELSDKIEVLCNKYKELFIRFSYEVKFEERDTPDIKKWQEIVNEYENDFAEKGEEIAAEFRKIIGVK